MSSDSYTLQLNVKIGTGYDAHLLNIVGGSPEEFQSNLQWVTANAAGIVSTITAIEAVNVVRPLAAHTASTQVTTQAPQQAYQQPQQQVQQQNAAPAPSCAHGPMRYKAAGTSKAGNAYNAFWSCVADRANQCKSVNA